MARYGVRFLIAILTFTAGITIAWALRGLMATPPTVQTVSQAIPLDRDKDSSEIYRTILKESSAHDKKLVVLQAETTSLKIYEFELQKTESGVTESVQQLLKRTMPEAELQTLDDYVEQNRAPGTLQVSDLGANYVFATRNDLDPSKLESFWARFYKKYPNSSGLFFFSKVGFNATHDQAFVYVGHSCGGLCGAGGYVLLRKIDGKWIIQQEQGIWVS